MARKKRSEEREAKKFGVILLVLFAAFAGFSWWRGHPTRAAVLLGVGAVFPAVAFLLPGLWLKFFRLWMNLAEGMSWVMTRVILSIFFFGILTPIALVMRVVLRKDFLDERFGDGRPTYWKDREPVEATIERYAKRF